MTFQPNLAKGIMNDQWITPDDVVDPKVLPEIPGYHILIRPLTIRKETKGGILLPDQFKDDVQYLTTVGRVVSIGKLAYKDSDKFPNGSWCDIGDYVCYGKHTGQKFIYQGVRFLLVYDDQIIMKIADPGDVDPMYGLTA